jgi:Holliday junction resolvasome RuvABC endonuclease subunit
VTTGGLLAIDPGSVIGWSYGLLSEPVPLFGHIITPMMGGPAPRFMALDNELCSMIESFKPSRIAIESPLHVMAHDSTAAAEILFGMRAIVLLRGYGYSVPISSVSADLVRQDMMGFNRIPGKRGAMKQAVVMYCRHKRGIPVQNHNAGDAVLIWLWHQKQLLRPRQLPISPELRHSAEAD